MENCSYSSSKGKAVSRKPTADDNSGTRDEESGWTAYFQDFSSNINDNHDIHEESSCTSFSLVSDAASYAACKVSPDPQYNYEPAPKKLSFKKTRAKEISQDDSLEDTASSPVNSPKVGDHLKAVDMKAKETDNLIDDSLGKRGTSEYYSEKQPEKKKHSGI